MSSTKYISMDVHTESISIAVRKSVGKLVMECVIETKARTIVQFIDGLRGDLRVTFDSAKPGCGDAPNTTTSSWMSYAPCTRKHAEICC